MFWFSSEIKSILSTPFDRSISEKALVNYLSFLYSPGELTPFKKVKKTLKKKEKSEKKPKKILIIQSDSDSDSEEEEFYGKYKVDENIKKISRWPPF